MDSKKLEILMTSIDSGSFIKASETVGYTQSGLTHMMDALEKEIGFPILERSHNGIKLNEKGKELKPLILNFLKANAALENKIETLKSETKGSIRVAAYASIAMHWMPEILYRFKRICPNVTVELRMVDHALEPFELLNNNEADVIFASKQDYKNINWTPLYKERLYAILPLDFKVKNKDNFEVEDFASCEFLMPYGRFDVDVNKVMDLSKLNMKIERPKVDDETLIRMVSRGLGVSLMSELMIRGRTDDVRCIPLSNKYYRELGMGTSTNNDSKVIEELRKCVSDYVKSLISNTIEED